MKNEQRKTNNRQRYIIRDVSGMFPGLQPNEKTDKKTRAPGNNKKFYWYRFDTGSKENNIETDLLAHIIK